MPSPVKGIAYGITAGAFWGLSFLIPKSFTDMTPGSLALARCGGFALVAFAVLAKAGVLRKVGDRHWKMAAWLSMTGYSAYFYILIFAIRWAGIPVSSLIIGLLPVTISLASRERVRRPLVFRASIAAIAAGIFLLNWEGFTSLTNAGEEKSAFLLGALLSVIALASWTCFSVQNSQYLKQHPEILPAHWAAVLGVYSFVTILPLVAIDFAFLSRPQEMHNSFLQHFMIASVILGFGCSYIAGVLWNTASRLLPTSLMGQLIVSETLFALLYGYIHDGILPSSLEALSIVLLVGGVTVGIRSFFGTD